MRDGKLILLNFLHVFLYFCAYFICTSKEWSGLSRGGPKSEQVGLGLVLRRAQFRLKLWISNNVVVRLRLSQRTLKSHSSPGSVPVNFFSSYFFILSRVFFTKNFHRNFPLLYFWKTIQTINARIKISRFEEVICVPIQRLLVFDIVEVAVLNWIASLVGCSVRFCDLMRISFFFLNFPLINALFVEPWYSLGDIANFFEQGFIFHVTRP